MTKFTSIFNLAPTIFVIFGGTGDLSTRKIIPALKSLYDKGFAPSYFRIIACSRRNFNDKDFRELVRESNFFKEKEVDSKFLDKLHFSSVDATKLDSFGNLKKCIDDICKEDSIDPNIIFYLATSPSFFSDIANNLKEIGLVREDKSTLIVEKPFGRDLKSAKELNDSLKKSFSEDKIFRIDHYLGKETVQNILVFRFGNGIFESIWNRKYVDHIQVSVCEDLGVGDRGSYFENAGIIRDIIQNHLLQMLSLLCIEPPNSLLDANSIRSEKVKVLKALKRFTPNDVKNKLIRGQYTAGKINGEEVGAYTDNKGVDFNSRTETYAAMKLEIDNWRWAGVPIFIRSGKRLPRKVTEILVVFKRSPGNLFEKKMQRNILAIEVYPNQGISMRINSKPPGYSFNVEPVEMDFSYGESYSGPAPEAYERLMLDAMKGDATLFARDDEIEEAWDFLNPIFNVFQNDSTFPLHKYEAGTWGPEEAKKLIAEAGIKWRKW